MSDVIEVLVPVAERVINNVAINSRIHDLDGKVVGFLWNYKPNGNFLLQRIRDRLIQKYNLVGTEWGQIEDLHASLEEAPELKKLTTTTDLVVIAVCD